MRWNEFERLVSLLIHLRIFFSMEHNDDYRRLNLGDLDDILRRTYVRRESLFVAVVGKINVLSVADVVVLGDGLYFILGGVGVSSLYLY